MSRQDRIKANKNIVFREEGAEALLFDPETGNVKVLNETGKLIWNNLDGNNDNAFLIKKLMETFDILDEAKAREDLEKFISDLKKLKFLEENEN